MQLNAGRPGPARLDLDDGRTAFRLALALTAILTCARIAALFASPLELYPDEAQY